jgi:hypothetical protein
MRAETGYGYIELGSFVDSALARVDLEGGWAAGAAGEALHGEAGPGAAGGVCPLGKLRAEQRHLHRSGSRRRMEHRSF